MRELITVYGSATPTTSGQFGDFTLYSQIAYNTFNYISIPKGTKLKIWAKRITGTTTFTFEIKHTRNITADSPNWITLDSEYLSSPGTLELEKRKPIIVIGFTGNEAIKLSYSNTGGSGTLTVEVDIEITDEE
jgi:hypothetical protein